MNDKASKQPGGMSTARVAGKLLKWFFLTVWRLLATFVMVGVITGCIVACAMTVYLLQYIGADEQIDLDSYRLGYTSIMYAEDPEKEGEYIELQRLYFVDNNRIWVDLEQITDYTVDALIAIEDKRFNEHNGVDWKRTIGAGLNMFNLVGGEDSYGGSTITQQLIKNITNDDEFRIDRKMREIFRALDVSRRYSRDQILETYLNLVSFGNGTNGIQAAANTYFDKDAWELTLAESAAIVGITKYPGRYNPFLYPENNKERQEWVLFEMLDQKKITQAEYDQALKETLNFKSAKYYESIETVQSYYTDNVIEQVITDLMAKYGWTYSEAFQHLNMDGYSIYTAVDLEIQAHLEEVYSSEDNFPEINNADYPQSASVIMEPNGRIVAMVGGIGDKEGNRVLNRATMSKRQPGSALKPLGPYSLALEKNWIWWSSIIEDNPIVLVEPGKADREWPRNYYGQYYGPITVQYAIQQSVNTVPAKLVQSLGPQAVFDFLYYDLNMTSLESPEDVNLAPLTLGALTYGVTPLEMASAYQIFVNGGLYTTPYCYTKVTDANGRTILEPDTTARQVISEDTAVVLNKLLQTVTSRGTGTTANLISMPTGGKTGTSDEDVDQWFIGFTPYYICQVWLGYDKQNYYDDNGILRTNTINYYSPRNLGYPPPKLFKTIMEPIHEELERQEFLESDQVVAMQYCTITGDAASGSCPSTATGWYRKSRIPGQCSGNHAVASADEGSGSSTSSNTGSSTGSNTGSSTGSNTGSNTGSSTGSNTGSPTGGTEPDSDD